MDKPQILVVEDEQLVALEIQMCLTGMGYDVIAMVSTGDEAVRKAVELDPDLILMDIRLKGPVDGIEAAEQIRSVKQIPIIFLTASTDDDTLRRAKQTEPCGFLFKPFEARELHAKIESVLNKYKIEQALKASETKYRSLLDVIADPVLIVDKTTRVVLDWNPAFQKIYGYSGEALGSMMLTDLQPEPSPPPARTKPGYPLISQLITEDKRLVDVEITANEMDFEGRPASVCIIRDITGRKMQESQMIQSEKRESIDPLTTDTAHGNNAPIQHVDDNTRFLQEIFQDLSDILTLYQQLRTKLESGLFPGGDCAVVKGKSESSAVGFLLSKISEAILHTMNDIVHHGDGDKTHVDLNQVVEFASHDSGQTAFGGHHFADAASEIQSRQGEHNPNIINAFSRYQIKRKWDNA